MAQKKLDPKQPTVRIPPIDMPLPLYQAVQKKARKEKAYVAEIVRRALREFTKEAAA